MVSDVPLGAFLSGHLVERSEMFPVARGRLLAVNGVPTGEGPDMAKGPDRALTLSWRAQLPDDNRLTQGHWMSEASTDEVSVEQDFAGRMGWSMGDRLTFGLEGVERTYRITSMRSLKWGNLRPNFYCLMSPAGLSDLTSTWIGSFKQPVGIPALQNELVRQWPMITVIDVADLMDRMRKVVDQVSGAFGVVLMGVLMASVLVLSSQTAASMDERRREWTLLRTLGAPGSLLRRAVALEFAVVGLLAGLLAAVGIELSVYVLMSQVLGLESQWHPYLLLWPLPVSLVSALMGYGLCHLQLQTVTR
jgi:putative ABC transport system permease protein